MASASAQPQPGTAIAARDTSEIGQFQRQLESRAGDLRMALPSGISPGKFQRTVLTAAAQNPDLLKADRPSLILACYKAAQDGLLPDGREAALVIFNQRVKEGGNWITKKLVQYMPMVYGLRKKILQARDANGEPVVSALQVGVVYKVEAENGYFRWERGTEPEVQHSPMLEISEAEAADANIVAAYSIATMADGTKSCEVMRRFEIDKVRQLSQTGATGRTMQFGNDKGKAIEPKGPWVDWFPEMAKKTVMRRHAKTLPMSGDVIADLGGEDDQVLASKGVASVLGLTVPDAPQMIEDDRADEIRHDTETGEIIEAEPEDQPEVENEPPAAAAPARARGKAKAKPEPERAQQQPAGEPEARGAEAQSDDDPGRDEIGITKHPAEAVADQLLESFSKAETIIDLQRLHKEAELDLAAMPDDIYDVVMSGYNRHRVRLGASRVPAREPEHAK